LYNFDLLSFFLDSLGGIEGGKGIFENLAGFDGVVLLDVLLVDQY